MEQESGKTSEQHPAKLHRQPPFQEHTQKHPGIEGEMELKPDFGENTYEGHSRLKDMVALVTGGDSGIGRAVCVAFAKEGAKCVCLNYLPKEQSDAEETKRVVEANGAECLLLGGDLCCEETCPNLIKKITDKYHRLDILVNNAAYQGEYVKKFEDLSRERVAKTFQVNILQLFALCKCALPFMKPGSSIINVASIEAYDPEFFILDYACSKAAIVAFTKGLARDPSLIERGVRVNCVAPGPVWTPLIVQSFPNEKIREFGRCSPMKRPAQPVELSPTFVFLASPKESSFITGEVFGVTGGMLLA